MDLHRALAAFLAVLMVLSPIATGGALAVASSGGDAVTIPVQNPINQDANVQKFKQNGVVSAGIGAPQMSVTIAEERDKVGLGVSLDPLEGSTRNDFIRITHKEEISRTVKIPIRAAYWKPFPREGLTSLKGGHTATLTPMKKNGVKYTLLTVTFDGKDSAVFAIPEDAVAVYRASERTEKRINSTFGVSLGITPTPWSSIPSSVFGNETAVRIEGDPKSMMIQYNAGTPSNPEWLHVPSDPTDTAPVYRMTKDGVPNAVYVVSTTTDPPKIRYKKKATWGDKLSVWTREAANLPERISKGFGFDIPDVFPDVGVSV